MSRSATNDQRPARMATSLQCIIPFELERDDLDELLLRVNEILPPEGISLFVSGDLHHNKCCPKIRRMKAGKFRSLLEDQNEYYPLAELGRQLVWCQANGIAWQELKGRQVRLHGAVCKPYHFHQVIDHERTKRQPVPSLEICDITEYYRTNAVCRNYSVDMSERKHGIESIYSPHDNILLFQIPWHHGVKHGTEKRWFFKPNEPLVERFWINGLEIARDDCLEEIDLFFANLSFPVDLVLIIDAFI